MPPIDPRELLPTERVSTNVPDPGFRYNINPGQFGAGVARGLEQFGQEGSQAGQHWGQIAADDVANQFQENANKILYGDPNAKITNPDGSTSPDLGYLGLKGETALKQRQSYEQKLDKLFRDSQGVLVTPDQRRTFDGVTRVYRQRISGAMGRHADTEGTSYAVNVNKSTITLGAQDIAAHPDDENHFLNSTADMVNAAAKMAEVQGYQKGTPVWNEHVNGAKAAAAEARVYSVGAKEPLRGLEMAEDYKDVLGLHYDDVYNKLRTRADAQIGNAAGDAAVASSGAAMPQGGGGTATPSLLHKAIVGQESGGQQFDSSGNVLTSVNGAKGAGQMVQGTFDQFALPGEKIENREDNLAASRRAIDTYYRKYNGDAARVAVAYFSGEGNVAPPGSPTPWLVDAKDGNGKSTSSYVSDINQKLQVSGGTSAATSNYAQMESTATRKILDMHLNPEQEARALHRVQTTFQSARVADEQTKAAAKERVDAVADGYMKRILSPPVPGQDIVHEIANDPKLAGDWRTREALGKLAEGHAGNSAQRDVATYGTGYFDAMKDVLRPPGDPQRISDPVTLMERGGPKGDLTGQGVDRLVKIMKESQTSVDAAGINRAKTGMLDYAKGKLSFDQEIMFAGMTPLKDPKGPQAFNAEFIPKFESAYAQWTKEGKDPYQFLTRENIDKIMMGIRSPAQVARDRLIATGGVAAEEAPNTPLPPVPEGISKAGWDSLMQTPPLTPTGKRMSHAQWSVVLQQLKESPTPEMKAAFDKWGAGANFKADEVLARMGGKLGPKPAAETGIMPKEALPPPAPTGRALPAEQRLPVPSLNPRGP